MSSVPSLWRNITSLGALQAFNFALTLVTLPYLTRTLGVLEWGTVVFTQLVINYLIWAANWSFYLGATKSISSLRTNRLEVSRIFMATWVAQWYLTAFLIIVLYLGVLLFPLMRVNSELYFAASGLLFSNALLPLWYLNGMEKMVQSVTIQIVVKLMALPGILIFVDKAGDGAIYFLVNSVASIITGSAVILWIHQSQVVVFAFPALKDIRSAIIDDYQLFISSMVANFNSSLIQTFLGIFGSQSDLAYYNLADRARSAAITITNPITHALFPRMCYLFSANKFEARRTLGYLGGGMLMLTLVMSFTLFLLSDEIILVLGGKEYQDAIQVLKLLAFAPVFTTITGIMIHQLLVPSGVYNEYMQAMFLTLIVILLFVSPVVVIYGARGAAALSLFAELFTFTYLVHVVISRKLHLMSGNTLPSALK